MAGETKATVFGFDKEKARRKAVKRVLANLKSEKFNCLEIVRVAVKSFLGLHDVTVTAHLRHIQESTVLLRAQRLAGWGPGKLAAASA